MKRAVSMILALVMCLSLCACGGTGNIETEAPTQTEELIQTEEPIETTAAPVVKYNLGDTVETDLLKFTLDKSDLTIACRNYTNSEFARNDFENYLVPKEYNAEEDKDNPEVASVGETLVAFTFTVENKNRTETEFEGGAWFVTYKGEQYPLSQGLSRTITLQFAAVKEGDGKWDYHSSSNTFLQVGQTLTVRTYGIMKTETESLNDTFDLHILLKNSKGKTEEFVYTINP